MNRRFAILPLLTALLVLFSFCAAAADEYRAFWVDAWGAGFLNQSQVDQLLGVVGDPNSKGDIRNANCNTVFIQVRRNCDACYPSSMGEPYMGGLTPSNFNALQAVINAAHDTTGGKQRIDVHCWLVTFRSSGGTVYSNHHSTPTGSLTNLDNYWPTRDDTGAETSDKAFDPGHPLVEKYITDVCMDLATNFDIDGIHYDYLRFTGGNQGYNPTSIARYNACYGLSGQPSSTDDQFDQWRRDQVTNLVRRVYAKVQAAKPNVKVSGSFVTWNPSPADSTRGAFQTTRPYGNRTDGVFSDWDAMMQEGIVDMGVPMTYYDWASLPSDYTRWMNFEKDRKFNRHMIIGPGIYLNSLSNAISEILMTRDPSPAGHYADGFSGYSYRTPYSGGTWATFSPTFTAQVCPTPANIPVMPWKSSPTKGHISGTLTYTADGKWVDGATVTLTGPENRTQLSDGTGFYAFIDLTPGSYTITVSKSGYADTQRTVNVQIGQVTGNMYVNDITVGGTPPPPISSVTATSITNNSATITWSTSPQSATSRVEYGLTTSYGSQTPLDSSLVTSHSVALSGLAQSTTYHYRVISTNVNGTSTSSDYTFITNGPPSISYPSASNITATSAVITWTTNTPANGSVNYGLTSSYGNTTTDPNTNTTSHSVTITGLTPQTTYHYQCVSANAYGTAQTTDLTFTTTAVVTEIIIDNTDSGWSNTSPSGSWTAGSLSNVPHIGSNYLYTAGSGSTSSTTRKCRWTPTLSTAGNYDVYVYYQIGTNRNTAAPYKVYYNGGSVSSVQNQYSTVGGQSGWFLIGQDLPFLAGSSGYVELTNASTDTNYVSADAAKWVLKSSVDTTAPVMSSVTAGPYTSSTTSISASWSASDPESGVQRYEYAVGSTSGGTEMKGWTSAGTSTSATITGLSLTNGSTYYVSARAVNGANLTSMPMTSSGVTVDTTAPVMTSVTDDQYTTSLGSLRASWAGSDAISGIQRYEYAVGSTAGGTDKKGWTSAGTSSAALISGMSLSLGSTYYVSVRAVDRAGLTSNVVTSNGVTVARSVNSIPEAKSYGNNEPIALPVLTVSAAFTGRFYIEETAGGTKRASGICVDSTEEVVPDQAVQVFGRMGLIDGYERAIVNSKIVTDGSLVAPVKPILFTMRDLGGEAFGLNNGIAGSSGVNNIGLLVTIAGKVTKAGSGFIYVDDGFNIDDGSGNLGVRVDTTRLTNPPSEGRYAVITGICTVYNTGTARVRYIIPRGTTVTTYNP